MITSYDHSRQNHPFVNGFSRRIRLSTIDAHGKGKDDAEARQLLIQRQTVRRLDRRSDAGGIGLTQFLSHEDREVNAAVGIAPLIVVPCYSLD